MSEVVAVEQNILVVQKKNSLSSGREKRRGPQVICPLLNGWIYFRKNDTGFVLNMFYFEATY